MRSATPDGTRASSHPIPSRTEDSGTEDSGTEDSDTEEQEHPMIRVALIFGGRSSEHSISCATAGGVLGAIDRERFEVVPIGVTPEGAWTLQPDDASGLTLSAELPVVPDTGSRVSLPESAGSREWRVRHPDGRVESLGEIDVVFPVLHGPWGEDGTLQGALELVGVPYVGNGVLASALGMDKHFTKTVLQAAGIDVAPWVRLTRQGWAEQRELWERRIRSLGRPAFVKPARAGSSVGVSRVADWDALDAAVEEAFRHDSTVIVEAAVEGREVECGVLSARDGGSPRVSAPGEVRVTGRDFYDFDAKYRGADGVELICPADLTRRQQSEMKRVAQRAFEAIGGAGLARVDFFFDGIRFVVNEVNTMPGFTPISMFPRCWAVSGLDYPALITELIELGMSTER